MVLACRACLRSAGIAPSELGPVTSNDVASLRGAASPAAAVALGIGPNLSYSKLRTGGRTLGACVFALSAGQRGPGPRQWVVCGGVVSFSFWRAGCACVCMWRWVCVGCFLCVC